LPAISQHPAPFVRLRSGWLCEGAAIIFGLAATSGSGGPGLWDQCTGAGPLKHSDGLPSRPSQVWLARSAPSPRLLRSAQRPTSIPSHSFLLFLVAAAAASSLLSHHTHLAACRPHAPYRYSSLTEVVLFEAGGRDYLRIHSAAVETSSLRNFARAISTNVGRKHARLDIDAPGTVRPLTDHNDTHDEAFGYSGRNWHGHTSSLIALRRKACPPTIAPGQQETHPQARSQSATGLAQSGGN